MNVMNIGEDFLNQKLLECASETVEYYVHNTSETINVKAVVGKSFFKGLDMSGFSVVIRSIDFIVAESELGFKPSPGDVIIRSGHAFEVFTPNNEPCWRYSGGNFDTLRIHTQDITGSFFAEEK